MINHEGPSCNHRQPDNRSGDEAAATHDLIEALCGAQTSGPSANDENVDVAVLQLSAAGLGR